jgi:hypothetical protein
MELDLAYNHVPSVDEPADHAPTTEGDSDNRAQTKQLVDSPRQPPEIASNN